MFGFLNRRPGRLEYQVPLQEARLADLFPPVPADLPRKLAAADREAHGHVKALDVLLGNWAGRTKRWDLVDQYLDERLVHRPPDVMATDEGRPS